MVREIDLMQRQIDDKESSESVSAILDEGTDDNVEFYLFSFPDFLQGII